MSLAFPLRPSTTPAEISFLARNQLSSRSRWPRSSRATFLMGSIRDRIAAARRGKRPRADAEEHNTQEVKRSSQSGVIPRPDNGLFPAGQPNRQSPMPSEPVPRGCFIPVGRLKGRCADEAGPYQPADVSRCQRAPKSLNISRNGEPTGKDTTRTANPAKVGASSDFLPRFSGRPELPASRSGCLSRRSSEPCRSSRHWRWRSRFGGVLILFGADWPEDWAERAQGRKSVLGKAPACSLVACPKRRAGESSKL